MSRVSRGDAKRRQEREFLAKMQAKREALSPEEIERCQEVVASIERQLGDREMAEFFDLRRTYKLGRIALKLELCTKVGTTNAPVALRRRSGRTFLRGTLVFTYQELNAMGAF